MTIYVYGTGCGAGDLVDAALPAERVEAFVDREGGASFLGRPVISLEQLAGREFDLLIVASREAERVERDCRQLGIAPEKLLFLKNHLAPVERNRSYDTARSVLGGAYVDRLIGSEKLIRVPLWTETERIAGLDLKGIKIHPAAQEINIMGGKAQEVYRVAQEKGLFLSFHTGIHWHRIRDYSLLLFDEVAWHYPELKFSMEHIGGYHFFREALAVMCNAKRNAAFDTVYAGWTSVAMGEDGLPGEWSLTDDELRTVIRQTGNHRSIFGLDFPYNDIEKT